MRAINYSADDADTVKRALKLLVHIGDCPGCQELIRVPGEHRTALAEIIMWLDSLTSDTIRTPGEAIDFCELWLNRHEMWSAIDAMTGDVAGHA